MNFFVYIIYSQSVDQFYKGFSTNFEHRLYEHNNNLTRHTAGKGPWKIVFLRKYASKSDALIEERRIKRLNRASILLLIHSGLNQVSSLFH